MRRTMALLLCVLALAGCGEADPLPLFSPDEALAVVRSAREHWAAGRLEPLVALCHVPFEFNGRTWTTAEELTANLKEQLPRIKDRVAAGDRMEAFGVRDLREGRWPRGLSVPKDEREQRMRDLGLEAEGYLVRVFTPPQRGWLAIVNPKGATALVLRGLLF